MLVKKKASTRRVRDRYELKEVIGKGGMGRVYRAYDNVVQREVALKTIRDTPTAVALDLFRKECSVLASLSHPNIVEIFDIGEFEEHGEQKPYFVMPLLSGATLDQLMHRSGGRMDVGRCLDLVSQACRGLHAAHEKGLIHRDMKPSNIFVLQDDSVKIIDFGVAHMVDLRTTMTFKCGTLRYMAPEQLQFQRASALSDLFSLGVVLYETLTLHPPFDGPTEEEITEAIKNSRPASISELNPAVSQAVSRVVQKALAKQPTHRFASVKQFADTLLQAQRNEPIEFFDVNRIQPRIERAARAVEQGDYQFASEIIAELEADGHIEPAIPLLRRQIEQGERQETIQQLLTGARIRMEEGELALADQKLEKLQRLDPDNAAAAALKKVLEVRRKEHQIGGWLLTARQHVDNQALSDARTAIQNVLELKPEDAHALQMLAELDNREQESRRFPKQKTRLYHSFSFITEISRLLTARFDLDRKSNVPPTRLQSSLEKAGRFQRRWARNLAAGAAVFVLCVAGYLIYRWHGIRSSTEQAATLQTPVDHAKGKAAADQIVRPPATQFPLPETRPDDDRKNQEAAEQARRVEEQRKNTEAENSKRQQDEDRNRREAAEPARRVEEQRKNTEAENSKRQQDEDRKKKEAAEPARRAEEERKKSDAENLRLQREADERRRREVYSGIESGNIECQFDGSGVFKITDNTLSRGKLLSRGRPLPGVEVKLAIHPGLAATIKESPSWGNEWKGLTIERTDPNVSTITIHWTLKPF